MRKIDKVYCDFDGTISKKDTVYSFLELFADKAWLEAEKLWLDQKITSKECLEVQISLVKNINAFTLNAYIDSIEIDEHFIEFYNYLKSCNIELIILSDGFDLFISRVLERYNLANIRYYANSFVFDGKKVNIDFPNNNVNCKVNAGSCKCSKIIKQDYCYIGDGMSDACVSQNANVLFAKGNLQKFCEETKRDYIPFNTFKDILNYCCKGEINAST